MNRRPSVPTNIRRRLWAESMGHCMNQDCERALIQDDQNISDIAHIVPNADDGSVSFDNLILLCVSCHRRVDGSRTKGTVATLRSWKTRRSGELQTRFSRTYSSFEDLSRDVVPLLERNGRVFDSYGPGVDDRVADERHKLWGVFEGEIIANNRKLALMLTRNMRLFPKTNQKIIQDFEDHTKEFVNTRDALSKWARWGCARWAGGARGGRRAGAGARRALGTAPGPRPARPGRGGSGGARGARVQASCGSAMSRLASPSSSASR